MAYVAPIRATCLALMVQLLLKAAVKKSQNVTKPCRKYYGGLVNGPTVFTLCNMHLKLMHFRSNYACILGRFLVYIELNLNAKRAVSSVDFICKMQWFLIYIARRFHAYLARISCIRLRLQRGLIFGLI